ncbi:hypothetical protein BGZ57DRAFT_619031 [Hyaloscypha finlandica]|nr:hypothetical protein BGZ57DRAFT_619031 [Hyaloscypha finlandica]
MQSTLGDGLGSKNRPAVLEKDRPDNSQENRNLDSCDGNYDNNLESVQNNKGQHYRPRNPTLLPSDSEGRISMSSEQKSSFSKTHDLNVRIMAFTSAWEAVKEAAYRENPAYAEQVFGQTGFLIALVKQTTLDVLREMAYPIGCEIERRLQEPPGSLKREWFSGDAEALRASVVRYCQYTFNRHYLPAKPPKKRGRPTSPTQSPSKVKKRGRPAFEIQPPPRRSVEGHPRSEPRMNNEMGQ